MALRRSFSFSLVIILLTGTSLCSASPIRAEQQQWQTTTTTTRVNESLRRELLAMEKADQDARNAALTLPPEKRDLLFQTDINRLDLKHTRRLQKIIRRYGWPTAALVGRDGAAAAFLIVQHSPSLEFQKRCLPLIRAAAQKGDLTMQEVALLTDRVLTGEGKPQIYGTRFKAENGKLVPYPIADPGGLGARRAAAGLPPLAEYIKMLEEMYRIPAKDKAP